MNKVLSKFGSQTPLPNRLQATATRLLTSRIGRETLGSMGLKLTSAVLSFLTAVLLARLLGPSENGIYAYVYALVSLLSIPSEFGLPTLVVRETARGMANQDYAIVQGVWRWAGRTTTLISLTLMILAIVGIWVFKEPLTSKRLATFLWALALVPLIALGDLRSAALRGLQRVVAGQVPELLIRPGVFALLLGATALMQGTSLSAQNAMALYVVSSALAFGVGAWLLWKSTPTYVRQAIPRVENRSWLWSALPLALISGMQLINQQAAVLLQGFFLPDAEIGIYRVAVQVSALASFGLLATNTVLSPRFAALHAQGETVKLQRLVTISARAILGFNLILTIGFVLAGQSFLRLAFGTSYETAYVPLLILLGGQLINSVAGSVGVLLNMTGYEQDTAKGMGLAAVLNLTLNLLLIPRWGIAGSSIATTASLIIWNVILWKAVQKRLRINSMAFTFKRSVL